MANVNASGDISDRRMDNENNDAAEGASKVSDGNFNMNATDGNQDTDQRFWHIDNVAGKIHTDSEASCKCNYYMALYNTVERTKRVKASNFNED